jgi:ParB family chromosome partitioning protein
MANKSEKRPALGRGLSALIPEAPPAAAAAPPTRDTPHEVDLDLLEPNPHQPRLQFNDASLDELAASIRSHGLVQPIVVRRRDGGRFEIIAGERRWRAAQRAGLLKVPVVVRDVSDESLLEVALIENIQREDLNPIDEALAYRRLTVDHGLTQEQVAAAVGKDRASVANQLRLLRLPDDVRQDVASGALSTGHAKALLALDDPEAIRKAAAQVRTRSLSVRETEGLVKRLLAPEPPDEAPPAPKDVHTREAEERLRVALGTRVGIKRRGKGGRIEIEFVNEDELIRLYEVIVGS